MNSNTTNNHGNILACPLPITEYKNVLLAHGGGGKLTQQLIQKMFLPQFQNEFLELLHDGAIFSVNGVQLAFTTDSYVINPIFFPGGDIGSLAVNGTINDLAMCGAEPRYLSAALIIEEGFPMEQLWKLILSMKQAAEHAGALLVTGDTKVVDHGKGDKIFINTSGIGIIGKGIFITPQRAQVGDKIIINGPIAQHGIAVMSVREGIEFETEIRSDTAALHGLVGEMLKANKDIHVLRDPTRGGLASALNEIASSAKVRIAVQEEDIPIREDVKGACEILGIDPLYVANEGKVIAFVHPNAVDAVLDAMHHHPLGKDAVIIGEVVEDHSGIVVMKTVIGGTRIVDLLTGEQLPRIC